MTLESLAKQGREKIYTNLAGMDTVKLKKLRDEAMRLSFSSFDEMKYKLEFVARINGMEFVNDASSRTPNATWYSLDTMEKPVIWIANGDVNDVDFETLKPLALRKVRMLICVGSDNTRLHDTFAGTIPVIVDARNLAVALDKAFYSGIENAVTLFSPACENGEAVAEQGEEFKLCVNEL